MSYFEMRAVGNSSVEIDLFGAITSFPYDEAGEKSAMTFKRELDKFPHATEIILNINSPGGSVFEGNAIHNMIKHHAAKVTANVIGMAASIASVVLMAADNINIAPNAAVMIHNPHTFAGGDARSLRQQADLLDSITLTVVDAYESRTGIDKKEIRNMMNEETWLFGDDAVAKGFADNVMEVDETEDAFAMYAAQGEVLMQYKKLPESIKAKVEAANPDEGNDVSGEGDASVPAESGDPAQPAPTADTEKETISKMDKATLMSEHADVANEVSQDVLAEERSRVSEIRNSALPGNDELVNASIENGTSLVDFLQAQTKAEQGRIQAKAEEQAKQGDETVGLGGDKGEEPKAEDRPTITPKFTSDVYARMNKNVV